MLPNLLKQDISEKDTDCISSFTKLNLFKHEFNQKRKHVQYCIKRSFDIILSIIGLILISPLLLLIAIMIRVDSKGTIIYKQRRISLAVKIFYIKTTWQIIMCTIFCIQHSKFSLDFQNSGGRNIYEKM